jgi:hypothetical protein
MPTQIKKRRKKKIKISTAQIVRLIIYYLLAAILGAAVFMRLWHFYSYHFNK